ncbi:MAG: hypothetical protein JXR19_07555 [Bacteroidia bacterium]
MKIKNLYSYILLAILLLLNTLAFGQFKDSKTIRKSGVFSSTGQLSVQHKHGDVSINSWDMDSIKVIATVSGESKSLIKLQEAMAKTNLTISISKNMSSISTQFLESVLSKEVKNIKARTGMQNAIRIDLEIYVPSTASLMLTNRYGNILMDDHEGNIRLEIVHGNLRANDLPNLIAMSCSFGDVSIESCGSFTGRLQFSEVELGTVEHMNVTSKGVNYEISNIKSMEVRSNNDEIHIESIDELNCSGSFSKIRINSLNLKSSLTVKYAKCTIKNIKASVCQFTISSVRSSFDLSFSTSSSFKLTGAQENSEVENLGTRSHIVLEAGQIGGYYGSNRNPECVYFFSGQKNKIKIR